MERNNSFLALDLETTGLDPKLDKIIELGCARVLEGKIDETLQLYVRPGRKIPERVVELTGITDEMVMQGDEPEVAMKKFMEFAGKVRDEDGKLLPLLGHSILFDFSFLKRAMIDQGFVMEDRKKNAVTMEKLGLNRGIDTLRIARILLSELPSKSLPVLCEHFKIETTSHRALNDALSSAELYRILKDCYGTHLDAESIFQPRPLVYHVKKQRPMRERQRERLLQLIKEHQLMLEIDLNAMSGNEADRLMDQIRSGKFTQLTQSTQPTQFTQLTQA